MTVTAVRPTQTDIGQSFEGITSQFEYVTPERAAALLEGNIHNRRLNPREVKKIAQEIQRGNWVLNGDTIRVSRTGALLDGQHRLSAIIEAGIPVPAQVVSGLPDKVMPTIDTGRSRPMQQIIQLHGFSSPSQRGAVSRIVMAFDAGRSATAGFDVSPTDVIAWLEEHDLADALGVVNLAKTTRYPGSSTVLGAAYYICARIDAHDARQFFVDQAIHTIGLTATSPARALRSRLTTHADNSTAGKADQLRYTFTAWNAYRDGRNLALMMSPRGGWTAKNSPLPH